MEYITTKDAATKWGISTTRITILANEGRIPGAQRLGKSWLIPANATKPPKLKANHSGLAKKETTSFSFPLYHFRPDWSPAKEAQLTEQQQQLLLAEKAVVECRFEDAYPLLISILHSTDDIVTEIVCLWNAGICCISLNRPEDFSRVHLRLQAILSEDFPHRDDLLIVLEALNTYVEAMDSFTRNDSINTDIHEQCIPLLSLQIGYETLVKEVMSPGSADTNLLELNLCLLKNTSATIVIEMLHIYLLGIYYLRQDMEKAKKHANLAIQIAFENELYFPLVTYYRYFTSILHPILAEYPEDFQNRCHKLILQYDENYTAFLSSINKFSVISKLSDTDFPYIYAVLMDLPNNIIADKLGISQRTVNRKLNIICEKLGVNNKKALKEYLHNFM